MTRDRVHDMALANIERNAGFIQRGHSLADLRNGPIGEGDSAVVIAAGPSSRRFPALDEIRSAGFQGAVIAADSAGARCLRAGIVPDLLVSVDPHSNRIVRWFGDPDLTWDKLERDDYFRRQDLDTSFADELRTNEELLDLMNRFGPRIRIALATSASHDVVRRVHEIGMQVFWWNPMLDDPDEPGSVTAELQRRNGLPSVNVGGNVGTCSWMMAHAVLGKRRVALSGMDFGYYADTPYRNTQYYHEAVALIGEDRLDEIFLRIENPHTGTWFYTDPAYYVVPAKPSWKWLRTPSA